MKRITNKKNSLKLLAFIILISQIFTFMEKIDPDGVIHLEKSKFSEGIFLDL